MFKTPNKLSKKNIYRDISAIIIAVGVVFMVRLLCGSAVFTEHIYPQFYTQFYPYYTTIFGWIPFSVGDVLYAGLFIVLVRSVYFIFKGFFEKKFRLDLLRKIILTGICFYVLFHFLWAFNYYKKPLLKTDLQTNELMLKQIVDTLLKEARELSTQVPRNDKRELIFEKKEFNAALPQYLKPIDGVSLNYEYLPKEQIKKYSLYSEVMSYLGVSGYYNPFTSEAQVTKGIPAVSLPFTMAHEQAHQMGYAFESEANFVGFITCLQSRDNKLLYSANYKALKYVLRSIYPTDSLFVKNRMNQFTPQMQADYLAEKAYYKKYSGMADEIFGMMNNQYLKANNQTDGLASYNKFVELLVQYYAAQNQSSK